MKTGDYARCAKPGAIEDPLDVPLEGTVGHIAKRWCILRVDGMPVPCKIKNVEVVRNSP